jgi:hypothetical protein
VIIDNLIIAHGFSERRGKSALLPCKIALATSLLTGMSSAVFAQGSTGGNIGQHDKSSSGAFEAPAQSAPAKPQPKTRTNASAAASCRLAGTWANEVANLGSSVWTITEDGTATEKGLGNAQGHAVLSGHRLTITWHTVGANGNYIVQLNQACTGGSGKTIALGGYLAGSVWSVTFTAVR